jgi:hypothetical protein
MGRFVFGNSIFCPQSKAIFSNFLRTNRAYFLVQRYLLYLYKKRLCWIARYDVNIYAQFELFSLLDRLSKIYGYNLLTVGVSEMVEKTGKQIFIDSYGELTNSF